MAGKRHKAGEIVTNLRQIEGKRCAAATIGLDAGSQGRQLCAKRSRFPRESVFIGQGRTAGVLSRQQRDVNRLPDPVLEITAVASSGLLADGDI